MPSAHDRLEAMLGRLFGYALALTQDREQARDLVQDCVVRALQARRLPQDEPAFRAWLFTILRNLHIDGGRRKGLTPVGTPQDAEAPAESWIVWRADETLVDRVTVRLAFSKLPSEKREVIALVDLAGFSYAEAATIMQVPRGTVMSRLSRARLALLDVLQDSNVRALPVRRKRGTA
ncbi:RNA polymerase sigma factor [Ferruginivarius sediminum]|uniref:RNA polymerase sigma factor n=1 Tax=Ferruginivarius sediminum TaxID=2661937 RepID=A0A369T908_9PROT|nr:RNA polymerase sigma factor [Ferruginivarius sediminum]RDD61780.1 RNA polymerase sigma factor [Ferruginivarius sediminum]